MVSRPEVKPTSHWARVTRCQQGWFLLEVWRGESISLHLAAGWPPVFFRSWPLPPSSNHSTPTFACIITSFSSSVARCPPPQPRFPLIRTLAVAFGPTGKIQDKPFILIALKLNCVTIVSFRETFTGSRDVFRSH